MGVHETRTFKSGNGEAVRLPKEFGFGPGTPVTIERQGDALMIRPVEDPAEERRKVAALLDALAAIGRPDDGVQARPGFLARARRGL